VKGGNMNTEPEFEISATDVEEINKHNFSQYFFDARQNRPKAGQIMARFKAAAVFGEGVEKLHLLQALKMGKAKQAAMVMRKLHLAKEPDCYRVCREICEDLLHGLTEEEIVKKDYHFVLEAFYYTKREYVPVNDPHWEMIQLLDFDPETNTFKSRIEI
jgi:hypothetical protein